MTVINLGMVFNDTVISYSVKFPSSIVMIMVFY